MDAIRIGVVGDFNPGFEAHTATDTSLKHAADHLGLALELEWLPTPSLAKGDCTERLEPYDGLWISAGSPYRDREGAFAAIRFARERNRPMVAT
jgi:CTP synthase (UTP-ammonia lyase)